MIRNPANEETTVLSQIVRRKSETSNQTEAKTSRNSGALKKELPLRCRTARRSSADSNPYNFLTFLLLVLAGCATVDTRWQQARSADTVQSYEAFLERYPDSNYANRAREKIQSLHWQEAATANTIEGFERYMQLHGQGEHVAEAKDNIESLRWQQAKAKDSVQALEDYLRLYPNSKYASKVDRRIRESIAGWDFEMALSYLVQNPEGTYRQEILMSLEERKLVTVFEHDFFIASALKADQRDEIEIVKGHILGATGFQAIKDTIRPKTGNVFVTVACRIYPFAEKAVDLKSEEITLLQGDGTKCETVSCSLDGRGSWSSRNVQVGEDGKVSVDTEGKQFRIDGRATILITAQVPSTASDSVAISMKGKRVLVRVGPQVDSE